MKKKFLLCVLGAVFLFPCFSQNMFLLGGEYNFLEPQFFNVGLGFNLKLFNEYIQNDLTVNFGGILAKDIVMIEEAPNDAANDEAPELVMTTGDPRLKFLFSLKDSLYFSLDWKWAGLRAGIFASFGVYGISDSAKSWDMIFNPGGFVGICLFPKSLVSVVVDVCPGYLVAFRVSESMAENEAGFSLPVYLGIRFNLDKL